MRILIISLLVFVAALLPRIAYANLSTEARVYSDMANYLSAAVNFAEGRGLITTEQARAYWAPVYPLIIGTLLKIKIEKNAFYFIQAVIGSISCSLLTYLTYLFVCRLKQVEKLKISSSFIEMLIPFLVGISLAFYDSHIFFTGLLMTETISIFLLLLWLIFVVQLYERASLVKVYVAGALLGVLVLTRPNSLFYLPSLLIVIWMLAAPHKRRLIWMGVAVVAMVLVMAPWTIRNAFLLSAFVPITTNSGVNFYVGHNAYFGYSSGDKSEIRKNTNFNEIEESAVFMKLGLDYIREHPMQDMKNNLIKLHHIYTIEFKPFPWDSGREFFSPYPTIGWSIPLFILGFLGLAIISWYDKLFAATVTGVVIFHTLSCIVFFGRTRFRVPLEPLILNGFWLGIMVVIIFIFNKVYASRDKKRSYFNFRYILYELYL